MTKISLQRSVTAPLPVLWDIITDHTLYAEAAPNLSLVEVVEGDSKGMVRRCVDTDGNEWTEQCTRWDDQKGFAVAVDVETSEFHRRLFTRFAGEWCLEERVETVVITIEFDFEPRYGPFGVLISNFFERKAPGIVEAIFDRWEAEIESRLSRRATTTSSEAPDRPTTRVGQ